MPQSGEFSLYFHIPFCTRKCDYCHFYVIPNQERFHKLYMEALKLEWEIRAPKKGKLVSIYFGGGTPSLLGAEKIDTILSWISPSNEVEITLEANPDTLSTLPTINRVSLGVQSFDDTLLTTLTRTHDSQKAKKAIQTIVRSGVENISIDLMYDLPGQTLSSWENTLDITTSLPITHLSLYNLTIEPHTAYYKHRQHIQPKIPNDKTSLRMLETAIKKLEATGLKRYEISAFAKRGFHSKHNIGYWTGRPFLGFGPSAFSYWNGERYRNCANLNRYAKTLKKGLRPIDFHEKLPYLEGLKERLAIRLRLLESLKEWPAELKNTYNILLSKGYLDPNSLKLSKKGLLFHDTVAEIIMSDVF